jgi:hypothetical protein
MDPARYARRIRLSPTDETSEFSKLESTDADHHIKLKPKPANPARGPER